MNFSQLAKSLVLATAMILPAGSVKAAEDVRIAENRVIYEVFVRNFSPEGNFKGVEKQIPRLKELGVDVVWLMPIYKLGDIGKWGTYSSPYAIKNYKAIDPDNGTEADLRSLVSTIHDNGMEIWFDWVGNHTSKDNVWVSTHPEYYGNYFYSPNGWNDVYQLDVNNAAMHEAMIDAMQYWVTNFDIDGYRCDYASGPSEDFWSKATSRVLKNGKRIAWLAEDDSKPQLVSKGYFDYNYAWNFHDRLLDFGRGANVEMLRQECANLHNEEAYNGRSRMVYLSNHDVVQDKGGTEDKLFGKYLKPLTVLEFTVFGMPLLYNGQEIQYKSDRVSLAEKTPINWNNPDNSMTELIKKLANVKHTQPALRTGAQHGKLTNLSTNNDNYIYAYKRTLENENVVVMLNFNDGQQTFTVNGGLPSGIYQDVFTGRTVDFSNPGQFTLPGLGYAVFVNTNGGVTPPDPVNPDPQYYIYVNDQSGWNGLNLYAWWNDENENTTKAFGEWPGISADSKVSINGTTYSRFPIPTAYNNLTFNIIANNGVVGDNEPQKDLAYEVSFTQDHYFTLTAEETPGPVDPTPSTTHYIYIQDKTGWENIFVYAYNESTQETDSNAPLGGWPGKAATGSYAINGRTYKRIEMPDKMQGRNYMMIINNNNGQQLGDKEVNVSGDVFFNDVTVTEPVDPTPSTTHYIYIQDKTGWEKTGVYAWGDAEVFGGWPGTEATGSYEINGRTFKRVEIPADASGKHVYLIANNCNKNGGKDPDNRQYDLSDVTLDRDYYFVFNAGSGNEIDPETPATVSIYVVNNSGWDNLSLYGWYTQQAEVFGGWPGAGPDEKVIVNNRQYDRFIVPEDFIGLTYHIIVNNGEASESQGKRQYDFETLTLNRDYYFTLGNNKGYELARDRYCVFFHNTKSWNDVYVYASRSTMSRAAGDEPFGPFPGQRMSDIVSSDSHDVYFVEFPEGTDQQTYNVTVHNNGGLSVENTHWVTSDLHVNPSTTTSVGAVITTDESDAVYYDLRGVRVENPADGIFIEVRGSTARKVRF